LFGIALQDFTQDFSETYSREKRRLLDKAASIRQSPVDIQREVLGR
jgi:hypothetical protein